MKVKAKKGLLKTLASNILILILAGLVGGLLMYYIDYNTYEEKYKSTAHIFVSNVDEEGELQTDAEAELILAKDCSQLIKDRAVMTRVIEGLELRQTYSDMNNISAGELAKKVCVCVPEDSRIIYISVKDVNPARAKGLADAISLAAVDYLKKDFGVKTVKVVESASMPENPVCHSAVKKVVSGAAVGVLIGIITSIIVFVWDKKIKSKSDVMKYAGLEVLAEIPVHDEYVTKKSNNTDDKKPGKKTSSITVDDADMNDVELPEDMIKEE